VDQSFSGADSDQDITVSHKTPEELREENANYKGKKGGNPLYKNSIYANTRERVKTEDRAFVDNSKPAISVDQNGIYPVPHYESHQGLRRYVYWDPEDGKIEIGHLSTIGHRNYQPNFHQIFKWLFCQDLLDSDLSESLEKLYHIEPQIHLEVYANLINSTIDPFDFFHC
jgi:hypothetical protein